MQTAELKRSTTFFKQKNKQADLNRKLLSFKKEKKIKYCCNFYYLKFHK